MPRRSSTPEVPVPPGAVHATRRVGGSRREANDRVVLRGVDFEASGWTLNVSRGGARLVLEDPVELGSLYQLELAEAEGREVKVVWVQDESDGQIVGVQFTDGEGSIPPPPSRPADDPAPGGEHK